ncbi:MAG TPA: hypothetical protein VFW20_11085 [Candidatus Limnocylindrales bacterium]|nr:hypothetical protein [Candidatus Limnocylindrales bacterium]
MTDRGATWSELEHAAPRVASRGRELLYRTGAGEALLATVRDDAPPRIHPIAIEVADGGVFAFILASPKQRDLDEDGRFALHAYPDAEHPDEFTLRGRVRRVDDATRERLGGRWPFTVGDAPAYEFLIDDAILGERESRNAWPPRYTAWHRPEGATRR